MNLLNELKYKTNKSVDFLTNYNYCMQYAINTTMCNMSTETHATCQSSLGEITTSLLDTPVQFNAV